MLDIHFRKSNLHENDTIVILINDQLKIDSEIMDIDTQYHGIVSKMIKNKSKFKGKFLQTICFNCINQNGSLNNIIIIGIGEESEIKSYQLEQIGGKIYSESTRQKANKVGVFVNSRIGKFDVNNVASLIAGGALLGSYKFDKYMTTHKAEEKFDIGEFNIISKDFDPELKLFENNKSIAKGVYFARDLVSEVPNVLYPDSYAKQIKDKLEPLGITVKILGENEMRSLGMAALLGVGQGSSKESKLVVMEYNASVNANQKPVCFVGKGVTFDTGGISLKPSHSMGDMKYDMAGSAAVVGTMQALALRNAKINAVGIVGLVENMPGSDAQRPGDVVTTMSGQTVEVLNTDAEGRLVLCDCITYLQEEFNPDCIIDLATLTGAILISLAHTYAGCFSNDDDLANKLIESGTNSNEKLWRMPLHKDFDDMLKSPIADVANLGGERGMAGSSTAAHFLQRFVNKDIKWAHLDIAGVSWDKKGTNPISPKGAVGFGVRLLNQFVSDHYESK